MEHIESRITAFLGKDVIQTDTDKAGNYYILTTTLFNTEQEAWDNYFELFVKYYKKLHKPKYLRWRRRPSLFKCEGKFKIYSRL